MITVRTAIDLPSQSSNSLNEWGIVATAVIGWSYSTEWPRKQWCATFLHSNGFEGMGVDWKGSVVLLQIVMVVSPGTHLVKNHESQSRIDCKQSLIFLLWHGRMQARKTRAEPERRKNKRLRWDLWSADLPLFTLLNCCYWQLLLFAINWYNLSLSLSARGSEERRTTARGLSQEPMSPRVFCN